MQYAFASGVLILAAWKTVEIFGWLFRAGKNIFKGGGGDIDV